MRRIERVESVRDIVNPVAERGFFRSVKGIPNCFFVEKWKDRVIENWCNRAPADIARIMHTGYARLKTGLHWGQKSESQSVQG